MFQTSPEALRPAVAARANGVTAVLGPTNTGKTHFAIERMLGHATGIIGLPLRLLAREVYNRIVDRVGAQNVALITGEEKIKPPHPRYWVATIEAMPRDLDVSFVAIDEIQLATNLDRGHVFTDRLLNRRGAHETLVIGADTMRRAVAELLPGVTIVTRPRLSALTFLGERKLTRLPRRSAIVAFSAEEVYAIAELIRRQCGGAAVVLGALSPRTRNAQVAMYQGGEVDYIVATDAIGMGLNLDVDHVAFAGDRKFDGWQYRRLTPAEFGQIAGRAGRHVRDGTFGTTGRCSPFDEDLVEALENHRFDPVVTLQWRNSALAFDSIGALQASLDTLPLEHGLSRAPIGEDLMILEIAARDPDVVKAVKTHADVRRLWEACQIPDYRKLSPAAHAELVLTVFGFIVRAGRIPEDWFSRQLALLERLDGDIDALSARIAQVRTWTYIANRSDWMTHPEHWQSATRQVEDNLSDALHERLAQRFVDRRTSVLMRRLRENAMLEAEVTTTGDVMVEGQHVGQLHGFRFTPDPLAAGEAARTLNAAAQKALASEIEARATKVHEAVDEAFVLANDGQIRWLGEPVGRIVAGGKVLEPRVRVLADEQLTGPALENVQRRLDLWLQQHAKKLLGGLFALEAGEGLEGIARGIGFQIAESLGVLERARVAEDLKSLEQPARSELRRMGVRFGAYHIYVPQLLKPAPRALAAQLWALSNGGAEGVRGLEEVPHLAASGRTSFKVDKDVPKGLYRAAGFRVCGERAVRVDILERLADLIRPAINYRPGSSVGDPPPGTADRDGFVITVGMTSLAGCSGEDFASILRSLGYVVDRRKGPPITVPLIAAASTQPIRAAEAKSPDAADAPGGLPEHGSDTATAASETGAPPSLEETIVSGDPADAASFEAGASVEPTDEPAPEASAEAPADPSLAPPSAVEAVTGAMAALEHAAMRDTPDAQAEMREGGADVCATPEDGAAPTGLAEHGGGEGTPSGQTVGETEDAAPPAEAPASAVTQEAAPGGHQTLAAAAPAGEEEQLIEVWRPHRHHQAPPRRQADRRPRERGPARRPPTMPPANANVPAEGAPQPVETVAATPAANENRVSHVRDDRTGPGGQRPGGGRRDQHHRQRREGAEQGQAPREHRPSRGDERREGRPPREDQRGGAGGHRPQPRERAPDPNSPFAKLAALKAELERKSRGEAAEGENSNGKDPSS